ncbi:MAG: hypothetical protein QOI50_4834, partial [Pseudonocardiales bacterium]|nr:hypothetical protein [Pseudonocardiales bacterium]
PVTDCDRRGSIPTTDRARARVRSTLAYDDSGDYPHPD